MMCRIPLLPFITHHSSLITSVLLACLLGWGTTGLAAELEPAPSAPKATGAFLGYKAAIQIGLEQHPLLKKSQETALAAGAVIQQTASKYYPQIDAFAIQTGGTIRPLSAFNIAGAQNKPTSYIENAGLLADQLIYDFGQTAHRVLADKANREAAEKDILTNKALVILTVQQAYLNCLKHKRLLRIAEETVRERGKIRDQVATLYKHQLKSKLDLDLISVELRNAEVLLVQAKNNLRAAYAALNNAMGVRGPEDYTLEDIPVTLSPLDTLEALRQEGVSRRPEMLGSMDRIRSADAQVKSAQALFFPTISAVGMGGVIHFSDAPTNQLPGAHTGYTQVWWGAGAAVSVPLFTGFFIENRVAEATQQKYKAEQRMKDLNNRIALEVTEAYLTLQTAKQQTKVAEQEVAASQEALALAKERYRLGLSSIIDVTTATTALVAAEVRLADTHYAYKASAVAVSYATGTGYQQF